jgi:hypothetical protein
MAMSVCDWYVFLSCDGALPLSPILVPFLYIKGEISRRGRFLKIIGLRQSGPDVVVEMWMRDCWLHVQWRCSLSASCVNTARRPECLGSPLVTAVTDRNCRKMWFWLVSRLLSSGLIYKPMWDLITLVPWFYYKYDGLRYSLLSKLYTSCVITWHRDNHGEVSTLLAHMDSIPKGCVTLQTFNVSKEPADFIFNPERSHSALKNPVLSSEVSRDCSTISFSVHAHKHYFNLPVIYAQ